jgi:hypothetical protein
MKCTIWMRLLRVRCWWRYWHRLSADGVSKKRYDQSGVCLDCGPFGETK